MVVHAFNLSIQEVKAGRPSILYSQFQVIQGYPDSVSRTHMELITILNISSSGANTLFWTL